MNNERLIEYQKYVVKAKACLLRDEYETAFKYAEYAHILGQKKTFTHVKSHLLILQTALKKRDYVECLGQIPRVVAAFVFTGIWVPEGNSGRSNVGAFRKMQIPAELRKFF